MRLTFAALVSCAVAMSAMPAQGEGLERLKYNNPGLVVDLGVGLWASPLPMDYDRDGDLDLVVACADKPSNGIYFFENPGGGVGGGVMPVFKPGVRIAEASHNLQVSHVNGRPRVLRAGEEMSDFLASGVSKPVKLPVQTKDVHTSKGRIRANQWRYVDYDGDGVSDLVIGIEDWADYGWDDAFNEKGEWTAGPLHGLVYFLKNTGTDEKPKYAPAAKVEADSKPIDVFGMPSPSFADYDDDGDLDLVCGEFLDKLTYFENTGTRSAPRYAGGKPLLNTSDQPIHMDLQMIQVVPIDWTGDGRADLVVGEEDGRVALVENAGRVENGTPVFKPPAYFKQVADDVKFGSLVTPVAHDFDGDGDQDLLCGNAAGYIGFIENLSGPSVVSPKWAPPRHLETDGKVIRIMAGANGSIQGPAEAKWGYTTISVADWDHDGLPDVIANSILGRVVWYRNVGTRTAPKLAAVQPIEVQWGGATPKPDWVWWKPAGRELHTQWRTTPVVIDATGDGLSDLVMLDRNGYLCLFERTRDGVLPPKRVFRVEPSANSVFDGGHKTVTLDANLRTRDDAGRLTFFQSIPGKKEFVARAVDRAGDPAFAFSDSSNNPLRLNAGWAGRSGRRKLCIADWDGDGQLDVLANSTNVNLLRNVGSFVLRDVGPMDERVLAGHDTSPTVTDFDGDGVLDLLVGAEDGFLYAKRNPRATSLPSP